MAEWEIKKTLGECFGTGGVFEVGQEYFGMNMPNLNAIAEDGRWGLAHSEYLYDLIAVDAYRPPYIPWHLTTLEFFQNEPQWNNVFSIPLMQNHAISV